MCSDDVSTDVEAAAGSLVTPLTQIACGKWEDDGLRAERDVIVVEEPIEFRLRGEAIATVMRTPGDDRELAAGFFFSEGFIGSSEDIGSIALCPRGARSANTADLIPAGGRLLRERTGDARALPATSSCGVCGKRTIEEILAAVPPLDEEGDLSSSTPESLIGGSLIAELPARLRERQPLFTRTGALHAAGLFDLSGEVLVVREDIGRHNAVDKAIGALLLGGGPTLTELALVVSGRVSFEIVQKALRARLPIIVAVSGVSSLAVELASRGGITLCGFTRGGSFAAYSHPERIGLRMSSGV